MSFLNNFHRNSTTRALACVLSIFCILAAATTKGAAFAEHTFTNSAGLTMPYRLLEPEQRDGALRRYPLVLFFHGAGERGTDNKKQLIHGTRIFLAPENLKAFPCYVLAPQCPEQQQWVDMPWGTESGDRPEQPSGAMQLALAILDSLLKEKAIDPSRIYVTGLSMGGYATWDCITRFPERFAAAVPVCGGGDEKTVTPAVAKVSVWAFHSDDDTTVKVIRTRKMIEAMRQAGGQPKYTEYTGLGHNSWDKAYGEPELLPWMFKQQRGSR
jgi:predicted peptidase